MAEVYKLIKGAVTSTSVSVIVFCISGLRYKKAHLGLELPGPAFYNFSEAGKLSKAMEKGM